MTTERGKSGTIVRDLGKSLRAAGIADQDTAAVRLAREYARLLDGVRGSDYEVETYDRLGPKYLAALTALGLTPAGRGVKGGDQVVSRSSVLDELRAKRDAR